MITLFKYNLVGIFFMFDKHDLYVIFQDNDWKRYTVCKISNVQVGVICSQILEFVEEENTSAFSMEFQRKSENSDTLLDIQKHIFETFSASQRLYFTVMLKDIEDYRYVPGVERFYLLNDIYNVEEVEELIQNHSELKAINIFKDLEGDISPDSNIFDLRNLTIQFPSRSFTNFTDHYKGRFAIFCTPYIRDARIFIDRWLRRECSDNIKHAWFFNSTGRPFDDRLLVNFGHKRIDRDTMPTVPVKYQFDKDDAYYVEARSSKFQTDGTYYTERFDGKFATLFCGNDYVLFSVWDQRPW